MAQNHPSDNIYNILNKLESLKPTLQEKHDATVQQIRESVEARGSITSGVSSVEKRLMERFAAESDFSKMSNAIQKTGKSKASADAITAAAGREKLGQKEMTRRAVAGKKKAAHEGNVVSGALADKSIPVGATIPGTNLKKNKQIEVEEQNMSRAAKGHEKYGKEGMQALARAGQDGASEKKMATIRNKYNKYDESVSESDARPPEAIAKMNKQHQDYYAANPHYARKGAWDVNVGDTVGAQGQKKSGLATRVTPSTVTKVTKKSTTPFKQDEAFNPNSVDAQQARDSKAHHHAELKKKADAGDADAQKRLGMIKKRRDADVKNFNDKMDYMEECAMCAEGTCTEHSMAEGFPTVADAKADHEKNKTTGKFDSKKNRDTGGTIYTRKSSTYDNGGKDKDMKKAEKKSVKESMDQIQTRFLMEASFKRIAEEHGETLEEMMAQMAKDMEHYHNTGHASHLLRDCMEIHWHNKQDVEETANRPELSDPWMGVKDAPPPASTAPTPPASTASFAHKVAGAAKNFGKKALNTLGGPDYEGSKDMLQKSMYDEELDELAELAGLTIGKRLPEASVKVDTPEVEPVNGPKEEYATMNQAPNVFGPGDPATIAGGSNGNYGGRGDNKMATRVNRPAPVVSTPSVKPVKTLESYIEAEYNSIKKQK
jgi:hypothetical protein